MRNITELVLDAPEQFDRRASQNMRMQRISCSSAYQQKKMKKCSENVPHQMREDLAITYHLAISIDDIRVLTTITNDILKRYGISEETASCRCYGKQSECQTHPCDGNGKYNREVMDGIRNNSER